MSNATVLPECLVDKLELNLHQTLQWRHNRRDSVSNHQPHDCLLNHLFRRRSKKTSKLRVTGLCVENSPVTSEFPAQMPSNAENVSIWWRHHDFEYLILRAQYKTAVTANVLELMQFCAKPSIYLYAYIYMNIYICRYIWIYICIYIYTYMSHTSSSQSVRIFKHLTLLHHQQAQCWLQI